MANGEPISPPKPSKQRVFPRTRLRRSPSPEPFDPSMFPSLSPNRPAEPDDDPDDEPNPPEQEIFSVTTLNMIEFEDDDDDDSQDNGPYSQLMKEICATFKAVPRVHKIQAASQCLKVLRSFLSDQPDSDEP